MSDGSRCHYCRKYRCECSDQALSRLEAQQPRQYRVLWSEYVGGMTLPFSGRVHSDAESADREAELKRGAHNYHGVHVESRTASDDEWPVPCVEAQQHPGPEIAPTGYPMAWGDGSGESREDVVGEQPTPPECPTCLKYLGALECANAAAKRRGAERDALRGEVERLAEELKAIDSTLCECRYSTTDGMALGDRCNCDIHAAHRMIAALLAEHEKEQG